MPGCWIWQRSALGPSIEGHIRFPEEGNPRSDLRASRGGSLKRCAGCEGAPLVSGGWRVLGWMETFSTCVLLLLGTLSRRHDDIT